MIYAYTGKTGSGKTYQMIKDVYPAWHAGVDIYSNTYLLFESRPGEAGVNIVDNPEFFTWRERLSWWFSQRMAGFLRKTIEPYRRGRIIYFEDITEILEARDGIILIDEGQALLEARNWENLPAEFSNKLRQHRKHCLDLYITTQNLGTVDINLRRLVQGWYHCKDVFALFGLRNPNLFSLHTIEIKDIDCLYNNVDDLNVPVLSTNHFIISKWTKRLYDTMYDIGFTTLKAIWIENSNQQKILIIPKSWSLQNARTQQLLLSFYLDQSKSMNSKLGWRISKKSS